jgi:dipeptidyl aminopeptidase/acylaminoacyl peptidase
VGGLSIAQDGTSLMYSQASQYNALGRIAFDPARRSIAGTWEPFDSGHTGSTASFSPDGSKIVFDTVGDVTEDLWIMNTDGSGRRRLTSNARRNITPVWSPNGQQIAFLSDRAGQYDIWIVQPDGSGLRPLTDKPLPYMQRGIWSPDGKRVFAGRNMGAPTLLDAAAPRPVANPAPAPGMQGLEILLYPNFWTEGSDGIIIGDLLSGPAGPEIVLYSISEAKLEHTGIQGRYGVWLPEQYDPQHRYFVFTRGADCLLYDRTLKRESPLFSTTPNRFYSMTRSPDGRWIYFTQTIRDADLWLASFKH